MGSTEQPAAAQPRIAILLLGGTIVMAPGERAGVVPTMGPHDLLAAIPDLARVAKVEAASLRQVASAELRYADIAEVAGRIRAALAAGADGIVVTQGTDTLEETAFQLDLLLDVDAPVVVTGALRSPTQPGADGAANLLSAVRVAAAPVAAGMGVLVVMNDEIHAARFVRKMHTYKASAFASPAAGPLGWIAEDRVRIAMRTVQRAPTVAWHAEPPFVPVIPIGFATDRAVIEAFAASAPAGAVVAALGAGHVPSACVGALQALAARAPVVLASRTGAGEGYRRTYGYAGGEIDLLERGLIAGGFLDSAKARVLLSLLLAAGADRRRIENAFAWC